MSPLSAANEIFYLRHLFSQRRPTFDLNVVTTTLRNSIIFSMGRKRRAPEKGTVERLKSYPACEEIDRSRGERNFVFVGKVKFI